MRKYRSGIFSISFELYSNYYSKESDEVEEIDSDYNVFYFYRMPSTYYSELLSLAEILTCDDFYDEISSE